MMAKRKKSVCRLKQFRELAGLTLAELSGPAECSVQRLWDYESARRQPRYARMQRIAAALDCTVSDIWP